MKAKSHASPTFVQNRWSRLICIFAFALVLATILLFLPITAGQVIHVASPVHLQAAPYLDRTMDLTLPFGALAVRATNGLTITKTASSASVDQGGMLTYTLTIFNNTGDDITNVTVTDTVPANTECRDVFAPPHWFTNGKDNCRLDGQAVWLLTAPGPVPSIGGELANGSSVTLVYSVRVGQPLPDQATITNAAGSYAVMAQTPPYADSGTEDIITLVNAPAWQISKSVVPTPTVQPGDWLTYTLTAVNNGQVDATGPYTISDVIPQYTHYISSSLPVSQNGDRLAWSFDETLAVGASRAVTYVVQVADRLTDGLHIVNQTYSVTGSTMYTGAVGAPVTSTVRAPALEMAKTDHVDFVQPGHILTYTLSYSNSGGAAATGVVISDTFDAHTSFIGSDPDADECAGSTCSWTFATLPAGDSGSIVVTVSVTLPLENGTLLTNMASITSSEGYGDQALETTPVLGTPVLHLVKEASADVVEPGDLITYTLSYSNSGDAPALDVAITDTIDAYTIFESGSPAHTGSYVWHIGQLQPSATHLLTLTVRVTDSLIDDTSLTNQAIISARDNISDTDQAVVSVETTPILHLVKEANTDSIQPGDTLTYTLWYSNTGNGRANAVVITDTLPTQLHFKDSDPPPTTADDQQPIWTFAEVPVGGPYSITLVVTSDNVIEDGTLLTNQVAMSSAETAAVTASRTVTVEVAKLAVTKSASSSLVKANEYITYTITVANQGDALAEQVIITDTLPAVIVAGSVISSASPGVLADGGATSPPSYAWTMPELAGQSSITLSISGRLVTSPWSADGDVFTNTVEIGSQDNAVSFANNIAQTQSTGRPGDSAQITLTALPLETTVGNTIIVTATVTDAWGNPAYVGESVAFDTSLGTMTPGSRMTQDGIAANSISSLQPGVAVITGTTVSNGLEATTSVTFTTGAPHHFAFSPSIPSPQTAGVPFSITIRAEDVYGNVVPTYTTSVDLQDSTGTLLPAGTGTGWVDGIWNGSVTITGALDADVITADDGRINGFSNPFDVLPGAPAALTVTVESSSLRICQSATVTTTVADEWDNLIPNQAVSLQVLGGPAPNGSADLSPESDSTGSTGILNSTLHATGAGNVRIFGEKDGTALNNLLNMPVVQISEPPVPTSVSVNVAPNPLYVGGATAVALANVTDCLGPAAGQVVTFTLSDAGLAWFPGPSDTYTATTNASGVATATITSNSTDSTGAVIITANVDGQYDNAVLDVQLPLLPELVISKEASPAGGDVRPGQNLVYTLVGRNVGDAQATGVVISDSLPSGVGLVSRTASQGTFTSDSPLNLDAGTLNSGGSVTVTLLVRVTDEISGTQLTNWARIGSNETESALSTLVSHRVVTNTDRVFLPIVLNNWSANTQPQPTNANLVVENIGFVGNRPTNDGDRYHVQVTVRNIGSEPVTNDFWVDLYLNPISTPTVNQPWQYLSQSGELGVNDCPNDATCYGRAWYVTDGLAPGATVLLSTQTASDWRYDRWPAEGVPYVRGRHNPMVALVDSYRAGEWYGAVYEQDETDNLSSSISGAGAVPSASGSSFPAIPAWPAGSSRPSLPPPRE
jgi:uncharacterized repeat protein (TIGR01451 family)